MTTFLNLTAVWFLGNILLAVVMFVGGFDFTFPQQGNDNNFSYFLYAVLEFGLSTAYLVSVAEDLTNKQD